MGVGMLPVQFSAVVAAPAGVDLPRTGADLGLFAGGVSVSRSHMSSTYEPGGGGGGDTCVLLLT